MDESLQTIIAVWTVIVVPFVLGSGYLYVRGGLTLEAVVIYWFPPGVLTLIGVLPRPWAPLVG